MTRSFIAFTDSLSRSLAILAILLLIAAMLVVCQMIFLRYFFRAPTIWQTDFVVYCATAAIFIGAPYVLKTGGHVSVDIVESALQGPARRALQLVGKVLGFIFCACLFVASAMYTWEAYSGGWLTSSVWQIPQWIPVIPMPFGFGILCLQYIAEFLRPVEVEGETA